MERLKESPAGVRASVQYKSNFEIPGCLQHLPLSKHSRPEVCKLIVKTVGGCLCSSQGMV